MNTLYIVGRGDVDKILDHIPKDDNETAFLFIDEGCEYTKKVEFVDKLCFAKLYILKDFKDNDDRIKSVDYNGWMEMLEWADRIFSLT